MQRCISIAIAFVVGIGCAARTPEPAGDHGIAEFHVDTSASASDVTSVTLEGAGDIQTLMLNPATGTFDGTVVVSAGPHTIVATAFSDDAQVGRSQPISVEVMAGLVTRVQLRILDTTGDSPPTYGPIINALMFPTTAEADVAVTFTISAIAPAGDPIAYDWSSSCTDSTFSDPHAAVTAWSRPAQGTCSVRVAVTSGGFTIVRSFAIVVFPSGGDAGALDVSGTFVAAPRLALSFADRCNVVPGGNATCPDPIASPSTTPYLATVVSWGSSAPGTIELSDSCGGQFGTGERSDSSVAGLWLPPVASGVCILTARATNGDGLARTISAAVLVEAGTAPTPQPPAFRSSGLVVLFPSGIATTFTFSPANMPNDCGPLPVGSLVAATGSVNWFDGRPGTVTVTDTCAQPSFHPSDQFDLNASWEVPSTPGATCTTTIQATSSQGVTSPALAAVYHVVAFGR